MRGGVWYEYSNKSRGVKEKRGLYFEAQVLRAEALLSAIRRMAERAERTELHAITGGGDERTHIIRTCGHDVEHRREAVIFNWVYEACGGRGERSVPGLVEVYGNRCHKRVELRNAYGEVQRAMLQGSVVQIVQTILQMP